MKIEYKVYIERKGFWKIHPIPYGIDFELLYEVDTKIPYIRLAGKNKEPMRKLSKKEYRRIGEEEGNFYVPPENRIQLIWNEKPKKKSTVKSLKKKAWVLFSTYIRLRDCLLTTGTTEFGKCITCGKTFSFEQLQASHFIAGRTNAILFDEEITHAGCYQCNVTLHGNLLEYRRKIIEMYGEGYDLVLEERRNHEKKFTVESLEALIEDLKIKISNLERVE